MKDKRKIVLGKKDVFPYKNTDNYINVEIFRTSDELVNQVVDNNFNLVEQFYNEREGSLKFCFYGILNSPVSNTENVNIEIKTNHNDVIFSPRIEEGSTSSKIHTIKSFPISENSTLGKNIFNKNKSIFYFLFELSPFYENQGETKSLIIKINDFENKIFLIKEIPFLFFDSERNKVPFGTETVDYDSDGNSQEIKNDFPFFYDTHWIKNYININKPREVSFLRNLNEELNNDTILESIGKYKFLIKLDEPSFYGKEEVEVFIKSDNTEGGNEKNYIFENKILKWDVGEQYKEIEIDIIDDLKVSEDSSIVFGLKNFKFLNSNKSNSEFKLNIIDDSKPVSVGFLTPNKSIRGFEGEVKIDLFLESPTPIQGQSVDVLIVRNTNSDPLKNEEENNNEILLNQLKLSKNYKVYLRAYEAGVERDDSEEVIRMKLRKLPFYSQFTSANRAVRIFFDASIILEKNIDWQLIFDTDNSEDLIRTNAIINEDYKGTTENKFLKTVDLKPGSNFASFSINLINDFIDTTDKNIVFKLTSPTNSVIIDNSKDTFVLNIKNNLTPRYTRYIIPSNNFGENGIFTLSQPTTFSLSQPVILSNSNSITSGTPGVLTNDFPLNIVVKNRGESIVFEDKLIQKNETFILKQLISNNQDIIFDLPSNHIFNEEDKMYEKSLYEFIFEIDEERFSEITDNPDFIDVLKNSYSKSISVNSESTPLDSSEVKGQKIYYLTTEVENVISKIKNNKEYKIYKRAQESGVNKNDTLEQIKQKLSELEFYSDLPISLQNLILSEDSNVILKENLDWQNINLQNNEYKYVCNNFKQPDFLENYTNVRFNGTLILTKNFNVNTDELPYKVSKIKRVYFREKLISDFCKINISNQNLIQNTLTNPLSLKNEISVEPI